MLPKIKLPGTSNGEGESHGNPVDEKKRRASRLGGLFRLRSRSPGPYAGRNGRSRSSLDLSDGEAAGAVGSGYRSVDGQGGEETGPESETDHSPTTSMERLSLSKPSTTSSNAPLRPLRPLRNLKPISTNSAVLRPSIRPTARLTAAAAAAASEASDNDLGEHEYADDEENGRPTQGSAVDIDVEDLSDVDPTLLRNTEANAGKRIRAAEFLEGPDGAALNAVADAYEDGPNMTISKDTVLLLQAVASAHDADPTFPTIDEDASSGSSSPTTSPRMVPVGHHGGRTISPRKPLQLVSSRPVFERNRCTITLTQGSPEHYAHQIDVFASPGPSRPSTPPSVQPSDPNNPHSPSESRRSLRRSKTYVVASDLSEEAYYAIEWAIGTVLRNGDELLIVTVIETDAKLDPEKESRADKTAKTRNQQDRQSKALQLAREATALLERTRLRVTVVCQAIHAKQARHMLIDLIDYVHPVMVITGSRGLSRLKGIILGSTSHYLIQKSSAPVMVTRRRLKTPKKPRKSISELLREPRVGGLQEATIDKESHAHVVPPTPTDEDGPHELPQPEIDKTVAEDSDALLHAS